MDAVCLGLSMNQRGSNVITPSQKRVPQGEKIRRQAMRAREAKLEKYKGQKVKEGETSQRKRERKNWKDSADPKVKS
jgi:hypothetical protein